jgi:hypothetical protein
MVSRAARHPRRTASNDIAVAPIIRTTAICKPPEPPSAHKRWGQAACRLRHRVTAGLNKGEAKNTLAKAACFHRLGEIRDRTYESQRHRASGLNLVVTAIILWNTVYLGRAARAFQEQGRPLDDSLPTHVAPVRWDHINLTGDYTW